MSKEGKGGGVKRFIKTIILIVVVGAIAFGAGYWSGRNYKAPEVIQHTDPLVLQLGWVDPLDKGMATHSSVLAWRIPWTDEPGGL